MIDFAKLLRMFGRAAPQARRHGLPTGVPHNPAPLQGHVPQSDRPAEEIEEPPLSAFGRLAVGANDFSDRFTAAGGTSGLPKLFAGFASIASLIAGDDLNGWRKWKHAEQTAPTTQLVEPPSVESHPLSGPVGAAVPPPLPPAATVAAGTEAPLIPGRPQPPPVPASALPLSGNAPPIGSGPFDVGGFGTPPAQTAHPAQGWPEPQAAPATPTPPAPTAPPSSVPPAAPSGPTTTPQTVLTGPQASPEPQGGTKQAPAGPATVRQAPATMLAPPVLPTGAEPTAFTGTQASAAPPRQGQEPVSGFTVPPPGTVPQQTAPPSAFSGVPGGTPDAPAAPSRPSITALVEKILATPGSRRFGLSPQILRMMPESAVRDMAAQLGITPPQSTPPLAPPSLAARATALFADAPNLAPTTQTGVPPSAAPPWMQGGSRTPMPAAFSGQAGSGSLSPQAGATAPADMREVVELLREIRDELRKRPTDKSGQEDEDEAETQENRRAPAWRRAESSETEFSRPSGSGHAVQSISTILRPGLWQNPLHFTS